MISLIQVQLIGRLGKDTESRFTPNGKKVANFTFVVNRRWKGKDGDTKVFTE